jgi:hypothetical protein
MTAARTLHRQPVIIPAPRSEPHANRNPDDPTRAPSFETDIKPLFRATDRTSMLNSLDLWSVTDVAAHATAIEGRLDALRRVLADRARRPAHRVGQRRVPAPDRSRPRGRPSSRRSRMR